MLMYISLDRYIQEIKKKEVVMDKHCPKEEVEYTKQVIRIRKSMTDKQRNGKRKRANNYLQNTTQNIKDRKTRTQLKTGGKLRCSGRVGSFCSKYMLWK